MKSFSEGLYPTVGHRSLRPKKNFWYPKKKSVIISPFYLPFLSNLKTRYFAVWSIKTIAITIGNACRHKAVRSRLGDGPESVQGDAISYVTDNFLGTPDFNIKRVKKHSIAFDFCWRWIGRDKTFILFLQSRLLRSSLIILAQYFILMACLIRIVSYILNTL